MSETILREQSKAQAQYKKKLEGLFKDVDKLSSKAVSKALTYLKDLGKRISAELAVSKNYRAEHLKALKAEVQSYIDEFEKKLLALTSGTQKQAFNLGAQSTLKLPDAYEIKLKLPALSPEDLLLMQNYSADLVTGLTDAMRAKVNRVISEVSLGIKTPIQGIEELERVVKPVKTPMGWVGSAYRAETILRTENNRVAEMGAAKRAEQVDDALPGMRKYWLTAGDERVRETHREAGMTYDEAHAIPIDQPFAVGGEELDYPGEPAGSPEEVVNCR
jgi:hypothetical protein